MARYDRTISVSVDGVIKHASELCANAYADVLCEIFGGEKGEDELPDSTQETQISIPLAGFEKYGLKFVVYCKCTTISASYGYTMYAYITDGTIDPLKISLVKSSYAANVMGGYDISFNISILKDDEGFIILDLMNKSYSSSHRYNKVMQCGMCQFDTGDWCIADSYWYLYGIGDIADFGGMRPRNDTIYGEYTGTDKAVITGIIPYTGKSDYYLYDKVLKKLIRVKQDRQFECHGEYKIGNDIYTCIDTDINNTTVHNTALCAIMYKE